MAAVALSELRRQKLIRMFRLTDHDHSGGVERADFERFVRHYALDAGLMPGRPEHTRLAEHMAAQWERLRRAADRSGDGAVTLDEYLAYFGDEANALEWIGDVGEMLMAMMDPDRDGRISLAEFIASRAPVGPSDGEAATVFARLDRDADGYLTMPELERALVEYFLADDPEAPGNELLGPIL
jgi:Ca2+-binding EF-hand superfamily protein